MELLRRYSNSPDARERLTRLLSLPTWEGRSHEERQPRQRQRRLRAAEQEEVVERYRSGETVSALADAFDITRQTVSKILDRHDVPRRYRILADSDLAEASQLCKEGLSLADIGERLGINAGTVLNAFRRVGFDTRPVGTNQWG